MKELCRLLQCNKLKFTLSHISNSRVRCNSTCSQSIYTEKYNDITTININRPTKRNCLNIETIKQISNELDKFDNDTESKVLIINGEGGTFCSGFDTDELLIEGYERFHEVTTRLRRTPLCDKITIAAMSGFSVAEGFELAAACDLRVIEDTAVMGFLGRRFGVPCGLNGGEHLCRLVGLSRCLDLMSTGRIIPGTMAFEWGLAARLVATGTALGQSINLAMSLVKFPHDALILDKLRIYKEKLQSDDLARNLNNIDRLSETVNGSVHNGLVKFRDGIGKHGSFKNLTEMSIPAWEVNTKNIKKINDDITFDG